MTRSANPYKDLPDNCFWSRTHRGKAANEVDPVVKGGFTITPKMKVATAGSCFAQHIARHLQKGGYNYFVTETVHPIVPEQVAREYGYGVFSARYGNLYTPRQLLQLAQRALGQFQPVEDVWKKDDRYYDPYRPNIQPGGFRYNADFTAAREAHFAAVRRILDESDVFVFTFGLTEGWRSKRDGAVFPLAPGVVAGEFKPNLHEFVNFTVDEIVADFRAFAELMRARNPGVKFLITVSPVPLVATARAEQSVITATAYSKAVLRVACEMLASSLPETYYFPSYEVITGNHARGAYFGPDLREVEEAGVEHVMGLFMKHYTDGAKQRRGRAAAKPVPEEAPGEDFQQMMERELQVICDEQMIERQLK